MNRVPLGRGRYEERKLAGAVCSSLTAAISRPGPQSWHSIWKVADQVGEMTIQEAITRAIQ